MRDEQVEQNGVDDVDFDVFEYIEKDLVDLFGDLGYKNTLREFLVFILLD